MTVIFGLTVCDDKDKDLDTDVSGVISKGDLCQQ